MKFHSLAVASTFFGPAVSAWMQSAPCPTSRLQSSAFGGPHQRSTSLFRISSRPLSSSSLLQSKTTASPPDAEKISEKSTTTFALTPQGEEVAQGTIVKIFNGGLVAIKVDDGGSSMDGEEDDDEGDKKNTTTTKTDPLLSANTLGGDLIGRQVVFDNDQVGVVVTHRAPIIFVYTDDIKKGDMEGPVRVLDSLASVEVTEQLKDMDCFGRSGDGTTTTADDDDDSKSMKREIFAPIPQVKDIALINDPLLTGVTMFDALSPIGKGQNMLLVGHDLEDMRKYVVDILSVQSSKTKCIYAATNESEKVTKLLDEAGLREDVVLVRGKGASDESSSKAAEATLVAASACSVAEAFATEQGMDTLVVVDNINEHKTLWDSTTRVLVDVFGVEAVVEGDRDGGASSEMRAFFSSLIQRSAQFKTKRGGGSVTLLLLTSIPKMSSSDEDAVFDLAAFENSSDKVKERIDLLVKREVPLTSANLRKIQIPIPSDTEGGRRLQLQHIDDLISMSDGQIWLDEELQQKGRRPPMDVQRSVTRVGIGADTESRADAPALRRIVEGLRLVLSQANDMDGAEATTKASQKQMKGALALLLAMHQPSSTKYRSLSESCVALLAALDGYLLESIEQDILAGTAEGDILMRGLLSHVAGNAPKAMASIDTSLDMTDETKRELETAIKSYFT